MWSVTTARFEDLPETMRGHMELRPKHISQFISGAMDPGHAVWVEHNPALRALYDAEEVLRRRR
jgi:hypothetical protein